MCGLAGFVIRDRRVLNERRADHLTSSLLQAVDHRGGDATGILALSEGALPWLLKASCEAKEFNLGRPPLPAKTWAMIGHTRFATQGSPAFPFNNHPLRVGGTFVAHNGHISNDRKVHEKTRQVFQAVDSAAIAAALDTLGWASHESLRKALELLEGQAAIVACNPEARPGQILLARVSSSPLYVWQGRAATVWASTPEAIQTAWRSAIGEPPALKNVVSMREGDAMLIAQRGAAERFTFEPPKWPVHHWLAEWDGGTWQKNAPGVVSKFVPAKQTAKAKHTPKGAAAASVAPATALASSIVTGQNFCDGCEELFPTFEHLSDWGAAYLCKECSAYVDETGHWPEAIAHMN